MTVTERRCRRRRDLSTRRAGRSRRAPSIWAAGNAASPLAAMIGGATDRAGRVHRRAPTSRSPAAPTCSRRRRRPRHRRRRATYPVSPRGRSRVARTWRRRSGPTWPAAAADVPLSEQGRAGHDRPIVGGRHIRSAGRGPALGLDRVDGVVVDPHRVPHRLPEPAERDAQLGVELPHVPAQRPAHHRSVAPADRSAGRTSAAHSQTARTSARSWSNVPATIAARIRSISWIVQATLWIDNSRDAVGSPTWSRWRM